MSLALFVVGVALVIVGVVGKPDLAVLAIAMFVFMLALAARGMELGEEEERKR